MTDTLTSTIRLTQPTVGGDSGTWAGLLNGDLAYVDVATNQSISVAIADANVTLNADGSSSDQARYLRYNFTGALTADRTVTLPANEKFGWATNNTTGSHNVVLSAGGTTLSVAPGATMLFRCDGSNVLPLFPGWQELVSYTLSGASSQTLLLPTPFRRFRLTQQNMSVSANGASLNGQLSSDGGSTFVATGYNYGILSALSSGSTSAGGSTSTTAALISGNLLSPAGGDNWDGVTETYPSASGVLPRLVTEGYGKLTTGDYARVVIGAGWSGTGVLYNAMKVFPSSGTFSGTLIMEGLL